ncbi:MAG: DMT family transporter [bacterium]|nr:DMT family transporter [bacterium]
MRYLIGAIALFGYWAYKGGLRNRTVSGRHMLLVVALGVLLYTAVPALQFVGLVETDPITFNFVFQAGIPLVLALTAGTILKERTSWWEWVGVGVVAAGVWTFFRATRAEQSAAELIAGGGGSDNLGVTLAVAAALFIGGSNLIQRRILRGNGTSALEVTTLSMAIGALLLTVIALATEELPSLDAQLILLLLVLGIVNTAVAFFIWHRAMETLRALHAGVIASTQLVFVPLMATFYLGDEFGLLRGVGSAIVLFGIVTVHYSRSKAKEVS